MKSQHPIEFDRKATMEFCWWWNVFNPAAWLASTPPPREWSPHDSETWLADEKSELWDYATQFDEKWKERTSLFAMEWSHQQHQRSAFLYEMGRRTDPRYRLKLPYVQLTPAQRLKLYRRWPVDETRLGHYEFGDLEDNPKSGWTQFKGLSFNLNRNDTSLMKEFKWFIQMGRINLSIPNPKPNKGRKNRGLSWRPVELMDLQMHKGHVFTDAERSQVSKAKRQYQANISAG